MKAVEADIVISSPTAGQEVGMKGAKFTGTAEPNATLTITDLNGNNYGTVKTDATGKWTATLQLPQGPTFVTFKTASKSANWAGFVVDDSAEIKLTTPTSGSTVVGSDVLFQGTAEPGRTVTIKDADGIVIGTTTADPTTGAFSVKVALPEGTNSASVEVWERKIEVTDLNVIKPLVVSTPKAGDQIGTHGTDFEGTGQPGDKIEIKDADGNVLGETEVKGDGSWELNVVVPEGAAPLRVEAGGQTVVLEDVTVEDDTAELIVTSPENGSSLIGPDVTFEGTGQPGDTVVIKDSDGNTLGEAEVKKDGTWELEVPLPEGGSVTVESGDQKVDVEDIVVVAPLEVISPKGDDKIGTHGTDFSGKGQPGETVVIKDAEGNELGSTEVNGDGTWDVKVVVPEGSAPITVIAGEQTVVLEDVTVEDDTAELVVTAPGNGGTVVGPDVTFEGKGQPGDTVVIKDSEGNELGEIEIGEDGTWELTVPLPEGGSVTVESGDQKVEIEDVVVTAPLEVTSPEKGSTLVGPDVTFEGKGQPGDTVVIKDSEGNELGEIEIGE
ncbi:Ig-like domain-containing protein, partial [Microbacterium sp. NPDC055988]|uniref:Ig-like domain-containing protein n=1 Tax=Microbacterium sp. NPDC055988 TaxID=3345671 RepID=UPI0035E305E1